MALQFYFIAGMLMIPFVYITRNAMPAYFSTTSTQGTPNHQVAMEKEVNHNLPFLDVLIDNNDLNFSLTRVYRKKTFTG